MTLTLGDMVFWRKTLKVKVGLTLHYDVTHRPQKTIPTTKLKDPLCRELYEENISQVYNL